MTDTTPTLQELAEEMITNGAVAITVAEEFLDSNCLLVKVHGSPSVLGEGSDLYSAYRAIKNVRVGDEQLQFEYEFDPYPPHSFGYVALYIDENFGTPSPHGFDSVPLEDGLAAIFGE